LNAKIPEIFSSFLKLGSGTGAAAVIYILALPLLTKLFSTDEFGELSIIISVASILTSVLIWRADLLIAMAQNASDMEDALAFSFIVFFLSYALIFLLGIVGNQFIAKAFQYSTSNWNILITLFITLFSGFNLIFFSYLSARKEFFHAGVMRFCTAVLVVFFQLNFGYNTVVNFIGGNGLLAGQLSGQFFTSIGLLLFFHREIRSSFFHFSFERAKENFINNKKTIVLTPVSVLPNSISRNLFPLFCGFTGNTYLAGIYYFCDRLIIFPCTLIGDTVWRIQHSSLASVDNKRRIRYINSSAIFSTSMISGFLILFYIAFDYVNFVVTSGKVGEVKDYFALLTGFLLVRSSAVNRSFFIFFNRTPHQAIFDLALLFVRFLLLFLGYWLAPKWSLLDIFLLSGILCYAALLYYWVAFFGASRKIYSS